MKNKKQAIVLFAVLILVFVAIFSLNLHGQILDSKALVIEITNPPSLSPTPSWSFLDKITEDDPILNSIPLKVGDTEISYTEERYSRDSEGNILRDKKGNIKKSAIKRKDYEKEIALKLLDTKTGQTEIIKITKKGVALISPPGYEIKVVERPSGITWNAWNTYFKVIQPADKVVIKNVYPSIESTRRVTQTVTAKNGKKKKISKVVPNVVRNIVYVPYSDGLLASEVWEKGSADMNKIVDTARNILNERRVYSKAFPDKLITEVLPKEFYLRRPVLEQSDLGEFILDPDNTVKRFLVILGTNGNKAWSETCNKSGACGLYQFTDNGKSGTYRTVAKKYPEAKLISDFEAGASDQVNSAMAAMLLDDLNLAELKKRYGAKIINDPKLEEYLAASYNGAPRWVYKSLDATLSKNVAEWGKHLKNETKGFMVKLRFLKENNLP